jgi:hypothetical protein
MNLNTDRNFTIGDKVKILAPSFPRGTFGDFAIGEIVGTYLYNDFASQTQQTGYRVLSKGITFTFDTPDFVKLG